MAKIYGPPKEIPVPKLNVAGFDFERYQKDEEEYTQKLRDYCQVNGGNEDSVGEIISFPVGDGYAQYMVFNTKPVVLIHMPLGDAWQFRYANRLTRKDVLAEVNRGRKIKELFSRRVLKAVKA